MKETDRGGEQWVGVASQLVEVGTARPAARAVPPQRSLAVNSSFRRVAFVDARQVAQVQLPSGPFRLMRLSDLTESELRVYFYFFSFLKHPVSHVFS